MPKPTTRPTPTPEPLEATNPPGPPEGAEEPSGALAETPASPMAPPGATQPQAADLHVDNSTADGTPTPTAPEAGGETGDPVADLEDYLATHHRGEQAVGEHPARTAVRLLTRMGARGLTVTRCPEPSCNLPAGHQSGHGWVHVEPSR